MVYCWRMPICRGELCHVDLSCAWHNVMMYVVDMHHLRTLAICEFNVKWAIDRLNAPVALPSGVQLSCNWN